MKAKVKALVKLITEKQKRLEPKPDAYATHKGGRYPIIVEIKNGVYVITLQHYPSEYQNLVIKVNGEITAEFVGTLTGGTRCKASITAEEIVKILKSAR